MELEEPITPMDPPLELEERELALSHLDTVRKTMNSHRQDFNDHDRITLKLLIVKFKRMAK